MSNDPAGNDKPSLVQDRGGKRRFAGMRLVFAGVISVVVLGTIGAGAYVSMTPSQPGAIIPTLDVVQTFHEDPGIHTTGPVTYPQTPPVGGPHSPVWMTCAAYASPVPNESGVHSMEHGAVWITYRPDTSAQDISTLTSKFAKPYVLISPYAGLPAPVVASAWGKQVWLSGVNDPALAQFLKDYVQGPQTPEPGSPCEGGLSTVKK